MRRAGPATHVMDDRVAPVPSDDGSDRPVGDPPVESSDRVGDRHGGTVAAPVRPGRQDAEAYTRPMEMLVLDPHVSEQLIAERQRLGLDRYDEVHAGRYVVSPSPNVRHARLVAGTMRVLHELFVPPHFEVDTVNVGTSDDFRVTDAALVTVEDGLWLTGGDCAIAVEVLSPRERPGTKVEHYRRHGCSLYVEIDPAADTVTGVALDGPTEIDADAVLDRLAAALGLRRT